MHYTRMQLSSCAVVPAPTFKEMMMEWEWHPNAALLNARIKKLEAYIERQGEITNTCTKDILRKKKCSYCQCNKSKSHHLVENS